MRYGIISDIHGKKVRDLDVDVLLCGGDFDTVESIRSFMDLEEKYLSKGKQVIVVPGNHDENVCSRMPLKSSTLDLIGETSYSLHEKLVENVNEHNYLRTLINGDLVKPFFLDSKKYGKSYSGVLVHGAFDGSFSLELDRYYDKMELWGRLSDERDCSKNFDRMSDQGFNLMIGGHDHVPAFICKDLEGIISPYEAENEDKVELQKGFQHVINPGAYFDGNYAIIDTSGELPIVEYCNFKQ